MFLSSLSSIQTLPSGNIKLHDYAQSALSAAKIADPVLGVQGGLLHEGSGSLLHTYLPPEVAAPATQARIVRDRGSLSGYGGEPSDAWSCGLVFLELLVAPHCPWYRSGADLLYQKAFRTEPQQQRKSPTHKASAPDTLFTQIASFTEFFDTSFNDKNPAPQATWEEGDEVVLDLSSPHGGGGRGGSRVHTAALEKVLRRGQEIGEDHSAGMKRLVKRACKMLAVDPTKRWVPAVLQKRVGAKKTETPLRCVAVDSSMKSLALRKDGTHITASNPISVPIDLENAAHTRRTHPSKKDPETVLLTTFLQADTDLGQVVGSLETVRQNFLNTKGEALMKGAQKIMSAAGAEQLRNNPNETHRKKQRGPASTTSSSTTSSSPSVVPDTFSMYAKKVRSGEESVLSLLRDKGMFAAVPRCAIPLLFRTPSVCGVVGVEGVPLGAAEREAYLRSCELATFGTPRWENGAAVDIPGAWFVSATHTRPAASIDAIEGAAGHSNYTTKLSEREGHKKQKTSLRGTLLSRPGSPTQQAHLCDVEEGVRTARLRALLIQYPATRREIIDCCLKHGVPPALRGEAWCAALGVAAFPTLNDVYSEIDVAATSKDDDQIAKDVPRCHQYDPWLGSDDGKHKLGRVLKKWVVAQGDVSTSRYIQGMASLAAPFITLLFHDEGSAYAGYAALMNCFPYLSCDPHSGYTLLRGSFYSLLAFHDAPLWRKIQDLDIPEDVFLSRLRTHFAHDVPLQKIYPIWDAVFFGNRNLVFALAIALLQLRRAELLVETEVTEATQLWKNSMLEEHVATYIERAKALLHITPASLHGPPSYVEQDVALSYKRGVPPALPIAYMPRPDLIAALAKHNSSNSDSAERFVIISTTWSPHNAGLCDLRVPLHDKPSTALVDRLEAAMAVFGIKQGVAQSGLRIAVTGAVELNVSWGPPPALPYRGAHDLALALCMRGYSGVVVCTGLPEGEPNLMVSASGGVSPARHVQPTPQWASPTSRDKAKTTNASRRTCFASLNPACVTEDGPLPAYLPPAVWRRVLGFCQTEQFLLSAVCRGLRTTVASLKEYEVEEE